MNEPVVQSLLETDLYKFTMWQALLHSVPGIQAEYAFVCRNAPVFPLAELKAEVEAELDRLCGLAFSPEELDYLRSLRFIKSDFIDFLSVFRFQRRFVSVKAAGDQLEVVAKGPIVHVMGFEIFVLYIVNELYFRRLGDVQATLAAARRRLDEKIALVAHDAELVGKTKFSAFVFSDFGVRRRYSGAWHEEALRTLNACLPNNFSGTSDVYLAKKLGVTPIGTMAHEYLQAYQAMGVRLRDFQKAALEGWVQEYRGDLGIALTDVIGMDAFLRDFDLYFAKLFDGLRHDSGDPVIWGEKAIAHYQQLRINPRAKQLIFSDGLDIPRAIALYRHFKGRIRTAYGIGSNLTNDTPHKALNIVMKLIACNGQPVAKLSDSPGKTMCDDETFLRYLRQVFGHPAA
ncbi:MAG: nicotinate phosphoribosyltransferase [Zoogloeaceae bacterium]|jgi:nicotinate phosphoribosyltransferase|nr:nicotinate phosphoribosyltransferase [Zoogloeaceae bacterium]